MCGIAGWIGPDQGWDAEEFRRQLLRRGPDGSGILRGPNATLVHTRLAILDLSETGSQPMEWITGPGIRARGNEEGKVEPGIDRGRRTSLVFNGEIYNFRELRAELEARGETFESESDTEVLLRRLSIEGTECLPRLAGMFAFAFWDEGSGTAILARDAFGIKPLYYRIDDGALAFASEAEILRRDEDPVDPAALRDFFLWGSVPEPATLAAPVRQIPAGHFLLFCQSTGEARLTRWHRSKPRASGAYPSRDETVRLTREALEESLRRHLVSDVPVGLFLSGGIDSTALLALARNVLGAEADLRTFSIGFDEAEYDESAIARRTAEHFGARHTEWRMTEAEGTAEIPAFLEAMDQPTHDGFNTWCVAKLARREGMKVVLSGLGGDEWFAGYGSFVQVPRFHALHRALGPFRPLIAALFRIAPPASRWRRLADFLEGSGTWLEAFQVQRGFFTAAEAALLARTIEGCDPGGPNSKNGPSNDDGEAARSSPKEQVGELEFSRYMRNQLLRDSDVFSMAHGLELRVPFVDVRLADSLLDLPPEFRLETGKRLLLDAVPEIPEWVRNRPKQGFRFPFQRWIEKEFGGLLDEAKSVSPVPLKSWYRAWTVAAALHRIHGRRHSRIGVNFKGRVI